MTSVGSKKSRRHVHQAERDRPQHREPGATVGSEGRDVLAYAANSFDEVRGHLEKALAATGPALVYVRLALVREAEKGHDR